MLPRERILRTLNHQEPDIVPWGEHWVDYNIYEDILGRETFVHAKMKDTHFITCLAADISFPGFGQIDEDFYLSLALHPEMHAKLAELNGKRVIEMVKYYAEEGIDGLIPCGDYGTSRALLANPTIFVEHVFPWLKAYCDEAHRLGMKVLKHCCGRTWEIFDYFIKAGCDAYESIQTTAGMDIKLL